VNLENALRQLAPHLSEELQVPLLQSMPKPYSKNKMQRKVQKKKNL
jgi:hypothetical protein